MTVTNFFLDILAIGAIVSAILVITSKNPVISVLFLIALFIQSACYLLVLGVGFVGLSYLIIYVGAITVLFLFVIMMINIKLVDLLEVGSEYTQNLPLGFILTGLFFYEMLTISPINMNYDSLYFLPFFILTLIMNKFNEFLIYFNNYFNMKYIHILDTDTSYFFFFYPNTNNNIDTNIFTFLQIDTLGHVLYTYGFILLLIMGIILFLSMFGAIVLSLKNKKE